MFHSSSLRLMPLHRTFWRSGCTPVKAYNWALNSIGSSSVLTSTFGKFSFPHFTFTEKQFNWEWTSLLHFLRQEDPQNILIENFLFYNLQNYSYPPFLSRKLTFRDRYLPVKQGILHDLGDLAAFSKKQYQNLSKIRFKTIAHKNRKTVQNISTADELRINANNDTSKFDFDVMTACHFFFFVLFNASYFFLFLLLSR